MKRSDLLVQVAEQRVRANLDRKHTDGSSGTFGVVDELFAAVEAVIDRCTNANVKAARRLVCQLMELESSEFSDFLVYLQARSQLIDSHRRKRLYPLYLVHDCLYGGADPASINLCRQFVPLFASAWQCQSNQPYLSRLLNIWIKQRYFSIDKKALLSLFDKSKLEDPHVFDTRTTSRKTAVPDELNLGVTGDPFYKLPASTMLQVLSRAPGNSLLPIDLESLISSTVHITPEVRQAAAQFYENLSNLDEVEFYEKDEKHPENAYTYSGWTTEFYEQRMDSLKRTQSQNPPATLLSSSMHQLTINNTTFNAFAPPRSYD